MKDPIGNFLRIRSLYQSYLDTAFRIADPYVAAERQRLLETPGTLCTEPLLEPLPRYRPHHLGFEDLLQTDLDGQDPLDGFSRGARKALVEVLLSGLFPSPSSPGGSQLRRTPSFRPYHHQMEMLFKGTRNGTPGVVTSGTGSGKTESFLLPIIASLTNEAIGWKAPEVHYLKHRWWHDESGQPRESYTDIPLKARANKAQPLANPFVSHRVGERRPAAVRALVLYPMNALVEDQLVRLRKALDCREVRETMDSEFQGNRFFFGRYTSATPTTGHASHPGFREILELPPDDPRLDQPGPDGDSSLGEIRNREFERCKRRQEELFKRMKGFEEDQQAARRQAEGTLAPNSFSSSAASVFKDETPFMFPSTDGAELLSRQDMQETPPDILITNISMLNAMLTREVDSPIFSRTREWLHANDESYFFLVLDELHLQRGSAGTEVCYLIRLLLDRLGLSSVDHRHKLRILASSASLPATGVESVQSREYLWDMFGNFGLSHDICSAEDAKTAWTQAIVPGEELAPRGFRADITPDPSLLLEAIQLSGAAQRPDDIADTTSLLSSPWWWSKLASSLGIQEQKDSSVVVKRCIEDIAVRLAAACWSEKDQRTRASQLSQVVEQFFGSELIQGKYDVRTRTDLARALLIIRGLGNEISDPPEAPSFRVHTFFRSIEGLYAPAWRDAGISERYQGRASSIGLLSIEKEDYRILEVPEGGEKILRSLEVLYCECCGELFFGGLRSTKTASDNGIELLPYQPVLEGLPDQAVAQNFEERSFGDYCVFWPTERKKCHPYTPQPSNPGRWAHAALHRETGLVVPNGLKGRPNGSDWVHGFVYERGASKDKHGRRNDGQETHVPYNCPKCNTSYYERSLGMGRLSPIRNFRAGFGKTTQLLATELFNTQRVVNPTSEAKLVCFSDSRQDAAKASLDIESNHHQDLRRELLFSILEAHSSMRRKELEQLSQKALALAADIKSYAQAGDFDTVTALSLERNATIAAQKTREDESIALREVLEVTDSDLSNPVLPVSKFVEGLVVKGVHPFDEAGISSVRGIDVASTTSKSFRWTDLFKFESKVTWRDDPKLLTFLLPARVYLVDRLNKTLSDVLFSKTYYSPEESGLGYVTVSASTPGLAPERTRQLAAIIRVLTDAYRYWPSPYIAADDPPPPWLESGDIRNSKVKLFSEAVWGESWPDEVERALAQLATCGHPDGVIQTAHVRIQLAQATDDFWRCRECSRVHLHTGLGVCTRCYARLPGSPSGKAQELWATNFLARRVRRGIQETRELNLSQGFRLHCEELTGQTDDPARRQREFRGIFLDKGLAHGGLPDSLPSSSRGSAYKDAIRSRDTIDLLAVTTTMEVGIDIGPLQMVMQANMPPQRFNYQQRVGRAGRRGQAFSMVLTVCRTKSHDLYYFRSPERITGDAPPPPFLSKSMLNIAERFLRKRWLIEAFDLIRREDRSAHLGLYQGDLVSPPDIHGEFIDLETLHAAPDYWRQRLEDATGRTETSIRRFWEQLVSDGKLQQSAFPLDRALLLERVFELLSKAKSGGMAGNLAELGLFPMFGMPTRIRNLYLQIKSKGTDGYEISTVDRDLDVAIYEFAPGAVVVKDKLEHLCVGFTADFDLPKHKVKKEYPVKFHQENWYRDAFSLLQCPVCSAWTRMTGDTQAPPNCEACDSILPVQNTQICVVPNGFRTDYRPTKKRDEPGAGQRHRSVQAEGRKITFKQFTLHKGADIGLALDEQAVTYRINRGPTSEEGYRFPLQIGAQLVPTAGTSFLLQDQAVVRNLLPTRDDFRLTGTESVWLASPKTTDSIYLTPSSSRNGLALHRLPSPSDSLNHDEAFRWQGVRAAALSAASMLAGRAALELDIDPREFEVLEPRIMGRETPLPVLQLTDELINGAGFCKWLCEIGNDGYPRVLPILYSMLESNDVYPRNQLLSENHTGCDSACYRCLLRYDNQRLHGLLDWRLGLSFLRTMVNPEHRVGLDGDFTVPELSDWCRYAKRLAKEMTDRFGGGVEPPLPGRGSCLTTFRIKVRRQTSATVLVVHPLWDTSALENTEGSILASAVDELLERDGSYPLMWDTFNLSRRRVDVSERIKS